MDPKKPFLSVVRDADPLEVETPPIAAPEKEKLPPVPAPVPESALHSELRRKVVAWDSSLGGAARLAAIGNVLACGAAELRPCMSAESAKAWVRKHADDIDRANVVTAVGGEGQPSYPAMPDLRDAVLGAAAELDEAGQNAPALVSALYGVTKKIELVGAPRPVARSWFSAMAETYDFGLDVLAF